MKSIDRVALGSFVLTIYTMCLICAVIVCIEGRFPLNLITAVVSGIFGTCAAIFYGFD